MDHPASADGQNESADALWPSVLKISSDEFEQSVAVAQLAVKLWEDKIFGNAPPLEKQKEKDSGPVKYLHEAWKLIEGAREHVLRPQTHAEYLAVHGDSHEAAEMVLARILQNSHVPFEKLCDPERTKGDTETIKLPDVETGNTIEVEWRVYRGEGGGRAFDNLFWSYWDSTSIIKDEGERKKYGQRMLSWWKRDGVPPNDFLALVRFRREQNTKRAANLKKKPKPKRRRLMAKGRE